MDGHRFWAGVNTLFLGETIWCHMNEADDGVLTALSLRPFHFQLDSGPSCHDRSLVMSLRAMRCYLVLRARDKTLSLTARHSNGHSKDPGLSGWNLLKQGNSTLWTP